jgi:hypothetical protein
MNCWPPSAEARCWWFQFTLLADCRPAPELSRAAPRKAEIDAFLAEAFPASIAPVGRVSADCGHA